MRTLTLALGLIAATASAQAFELVVRSDGIEARGTPARAERFDATERFARSAEYRSTSHMENNGEGSLLVRFDGSILDGPLVDALKDAGL